MYNISKKNRLHTNIKFKTKTVKKLNKKIITKQKKQYGGSPDIKIISELHLLPFDTYGVFLNPIYGMLWNINLIPNYYMFMCSINIIGKFVKNLFTSPIFNEITPSKTGILGKLTSNDLGQIIAIYYIKKCEKEKPYFVSANTPKSKTPKKIRLTQKQEPSDKDIYNCLYIKPKKSDGEQSHLGFAGEYKDIDEKFAAFKRFINISVNDIITNKYCFHVLLAFIWAKAENLSNIYDYLSGVSEQLNKLPIDAQKHYGFDIIIANIAQILLPPSLNILKSKQSKFSLDKEQHLESLNVNVQSQNSNVFEEKTVNHDDEPATVQNELQKISNIDIITTLIENINKITGNLKLINIATAVVKTDSGNISFTDCTETVIRNIINILLKYTIITLDDLSPIYKEYFTIFAGTDKQSGNKLLSYAGSMYTGRNAWAKIVSNIDKISYAESFIDFKYNMEGYEDNLYDMLIQILNIKQSNISENKPITNKELVNKFLKKKGLIFEDHSKTDIEHVINIIIHSKPIFKIRLVKGHAYIEYIQDDKEITDADQAKITKLFESLHAYPDLYKILSGINNRPLDIAPIDSLQPLMLYKITNEIAIQYCNNLENYNKTKINFELKLIYSNMYCFAIQTYEDIIINQIQNVIWPSDILNNLNLSNIPYEILEKFGIKLDDKGYISELTIYYKPSVTDIGRKVIVSEDMFKFKLPNVKSILMDCEIIRYTTLPNNLEYITFNTEFVGNPILKLLPNTVTHLLLKGNTIFSKDVNIPKMIKVLVIDQYDIPITLHNTLLKLIVTYVNTNIIIPKSLTHFTVMNEFANTEIDFTHAENLTHIALYCNPYDFSADLEVYDSNWDKLSNCPNLKTIMFLNNVILFRQPIIIYIDLNLPDNINTIIIGINDINCELKFYNEFQVTNEFAEKTYKIIITEFVSKLNIKLLKQKFPKSTFELSSFYNVFEEYFK